MNARILIILLVVSVLLAFTQRYRKAGLGSSAVLVLLLLWFSIRQPTDELPVDMGTASPPIVPAVAKPVAQLLDMQLDGNGAPWHLSGKVQNSSKVDVRSVNVNIERFDCPAPDALQADCQLLWQGARVLHVNIPVEGSARVDESFYSRTPVSRANGVVRDRITIVAVQ